MSRNAFAMGLSVLVLVTASCESAAEPDLSHAATMLNCGPADEGFAALLLAREPIASAQPAYPYVLVQFWAPLSDLERTWNITTDLGPSAWYVRGPSTREAATMGRIIVSSVDQTRRVVGSLALNFPSRLVAEDFDAPWADIGATCP